MKREGIARIWLGEGNLPHKLPGVTGEEVGQPRLYEEPTTHQRYAVNGEGRTGKETTGQGIARPYLSEGSTLHHRHGAKGGGTKSEGTMGEGTTSKGIA
jgi:hypothetical protein